MNSDHDDSLEREPSVANLVKEVLEGMPESLHDHDVVVSFNDGSFQLRDTFAFQKLQKFGLMNDLRMSGLVCLLEIKTKLTIFKATSSPVLMSLAIHLLEYAQDGKSTLQLTIRFNRISQL